MSIDTIARAIDLARGLSWFDDYSRWAAAWLDGSELLARIGGTGIQSGEAMDQLRRRVPGLPLPVVRGHRRGGARSGG